MSQVAEDHRVIERTVARRHRWSQPSVEQQNGQTEAEVADAVDQEGLCRRLCRGRSLIVEADEQVAAQADRLPAEIEQQEVSRQHQRAHAEDEQAHEGEEPFVTVLGAPVMSHVVA